MELQQIEAAFRERADDSGGFLLYPFEQVARWASEGEREAAVRAKLIFDRTSSDLCDIAIVANQDRYALSPLIFEVETAWLDRSPALPGQRPRLLSRVDQTNAQYRRCGSGDYGQGWRMREYAIDGQWLTLYPKPDAGYATPMPSLIRLEVYRLPRFDLEDPDDEPEIPHVHHDGLVDWLLFRAYGMKDSETYDPDRSAAAEERFVAHYGERPSAAAMRMQAEGRRWTTGYGGL